MRFRWTALAPILLLFACGTEHTELSQDPSTADPAPIGSDVGAAGTDVTGLPPVPGDSGIVEGAHP